MKTTPVSTAALMAAALGLCTSFYTGSPASTASAAEAAHASGTSPAATIVLKAAHVFDATGTALRDGATVVVTGGKIVSVGNGPTPTGAQVIDLGDATLLPGFIDAH